MSKPRAYTPEEVKAAFLEKAWDIIEFWDKESRVQDTREKIAGAIFTMLSTIDGSAIDLPGFKLIPNPHENDKAYCQKRGQDWFPNDCDIAGSLHESFYGAEPGRAIQKKQEKRQ